jgi:transposase
MPPVNRNQPKRAKSSESQYSLMEFMAEFPDDATCLDWLWRNRFSHDGTHAHCSTCETETAFARYETKQRRQSWTCQSCGHHLHPTAGTIFHKSSTSLHLWFYAMYLMTSTRCGISAKQLERELGVTYKTAWRMAFLIRNKLMDQGAEPLQGNGKKQRPVEIDETYYGGRRRMNRGGSRGRHHRIPVLGMVQRGGKVYATPVKSVKAETLVGQIQERILPATTVYTDTLPSYNQLGAKGYRHTRINHSASIYVAGNVHTNTIEGFWSLVKRGIGGVYHAVSAKHLQGYLNEYAWRYNQRFEDRDRFQLLLLRATI